MAQVIGYVKLLQNGVFFAKDAQGEIRELKAGDQIFQNELIYGSPDNPQNAQVIVGVTLADASDITLSGAAQLYTDLSVIGGAFDKEEAVVSKDAMSNAWALSTNTPNPDTTTTGDAPAAGLEATAAGQSLTDTEQAGGPAFSERTGSLGGVDTTLYGTQNGGNTNGTGLEAGGNTYIDVTAPDAPTITATDGDGDNKPTASGIAEAGSTVTITWPDGSTSITTADATTGAYSVEASTVQTTGTVSVTATDAAGNTSTLGIATYIDVTAPDAPTITATDGDGDNKPTASGIAEAGSTVTITWPDGSTSITTADATTGAYSVEASTVQTTGTVSVTATDAAGNTSTLGIATYTDVTAPDAPTITATDGDGDNKPTASGIAEAGSTVTITWPDGSTSITTADATTGAYSVEASTVQTTGTVSVTATDAAGNTSTLGIATYTDVTAPDAPTITATDGDGDNKPTASGIAEAGSTVTITWPDGSTSITTADATTGAYSVEASTVQTTGTVSVTATDAAGNTSTLGIATYTDVTAPDAPTITATDGDGDNKPTASGIAEAGSTVTITWPDGSTSITTADATTGAYSVESSTTQTTGTVSVTATDAAGNTSVPASATFTDIVVPPVDTTAPDAPTITATDGDGDHMPTASGVAEAGSTVTITWPDGSTSITTADATTGAYSVESSTTQTTGTVSVTATDAAGNTSVPASVTFTDIVVPPVDTTAPDAPTITATDGDGDHMPTASGVAEAGSTVTITWPDGSTSITTADATTGAYSVESSTTQTTGTVSVTATDAAGNTSVPASATFTDIVVPPVDTTAPDAPTITATDGDGDHMPTASGVAEAGSTVTITWPDGSTSITTADATTGAYSVESSTTQTTGTVSVTATDAAGNTSVPASVTFTDIVVPPVDTTAPDAPTITATDGDGDHMPTASGVAEAGSTVTITWPDGSTSITTADATTGAYSVESSTTQTTGTVSVTATDAAGNTSVPASVTFTDIVVPPVDTTAPDAPTITATDGDGDHMPTASGVAEAGSTVTITWPDGSTSTTTADATTGAYSVESSTTQTTGTVSVTATDAAGNTSVPASATFTDIVVPPVDTTAPDAPTITATDGDGDHMPTASGVAEAGSTVTITWPDGSTSITTADATTGAYSVESSTTQTTGTVSVTATDAAGNTSVPASVTFTDIVVPPVDTTAPDAPTITATDGDGDHMPTASGVAEAGSTVTITWPDGSTSTTTADATTGAYSVESSTTQTTGTVSVTATDAAGNTSVPATATYTDATAPSAPSVELANDTGTSGTDLITKDGHLTVTPSEAGNSIEYSTDGGTTWSSTEPTPSEGSNTVHVREIDSANNPSASTSITYTYDTSAPTVTITTIPLTNDTTPALSGTVDDATATVVVTIGSTDYTAVNNGDGTWTLADNAVAALSDGSTTVSVKATDVAGNTGTSSGTVFVDATAPSAPSVELANDTGTSGTDLITKDGHLTVTPSEAGNSIEYSTDGGTTWSSTEPTPSEGSNTVHVREIDSANNPSASTSITYTYDTSAPTVTITTIPLTNDTTPALSGTVDDATATVVVTIGSTDYTAVNNGDGTWTLADNAVAALSDGSTTVSVKATDVAGNTGTSSGTVFVDATAPSAPSVELANDTGTSGTDLITKDGHLTVTPSEAGNSIEYSTDGGTTWSSTEPTPSEGSNTVHVREIDSANNPSASTSITYTYDTSAPTVTITTIPLTNDTTPALSGTVDDATATVVVTIGSTDYTAVNNGDGTWTLADNAVAALSDGSTTVSVKATDVAGNTGTSSGTVFVDATAPSAPSVELANDTGTSGTDLITKDGHLTVTPSEAGNSIEYSTDGGTTWSSTEPTPSEGSNTVHVREIDSANNPSASTSITYTYDTSAPTVTITTIPLTNDTTPALSGTVDDATATVVVTIGSTDYTAVNNGDGTWTLADNAVAALSDGSTTVSVKATDVAGNTGTSSGTVFVDATAPSAPSVELANDTGTSGTDLITKDGHLTVTPSEAGNSIEYSTDGGTTWSSTEPTPSEGSNTVHVREIDSANNPSASTSITYTYDTSAPTVTITTIPLTNDTTPALSGTVDDATATVVVTIGSTDYTAVNNGDGTWTLADNAVAALSDGSTTVSVKATDVAGNTGTSSGTVFVDATAPSAPSVELANDTGTSGTDLITKDGHLTVTPSEAGNSIEYSTDGGTTWSSTEPTPSEGSNTVHVREIDSANNPSASTSITYTYDTSAPTVTITTIPLTNDTTPALSGTVDDATATVVVTIGSTDYTAVNNGDGTWTLADNAVAALSDGSTTVSVKATDVAGNTGTSSGTVFVDATAPSAPSVELANDTGTSGTDLITKDGHLTVTPSEAGNSIEYSTDGGTTWSSTEPTPSEGSNTVHVREIDSANNPSASTSITYTYDTSAPTVTITTIPLTNDTTPALSGTVDDATATVVVTIGSTDYTAVNNGDGTWTLADNAVAALSDGSTTVSVKATDVAGNTGTSSGTVFVDATAPSAPSVELANDTGTSGTDLITKDGHLTVTPSEAGNSIEYSTDGGTTWSSTEPTPSEGSNTVHVREIDSANNPSASTSITYTYDTSAPTVTITTIPLTNDTTPALSGTVDDATATVVVTIGSTDYTAVNNGDGTWTLADNAVAALSDGSTTVSVKATDVAGNTGTSSGTVFVDATAPSAPSVELANDTGTSGTDLITKDGHLTVTPSEAGNSIEYSTDGGTTWSSTEPTPSEGSNTVHVREIDSANNPSASTSITYTYDTSAPTVTITTIPLTNDTTPALSGTVDDATATVVVTIGSTDYTAVNNGDGTWTLADNAVAALSDGSTTVSVKATDVAGNTGTSSGTVFVDATAPSAPSVELANDTGTSGTDLITKDGHLTVTPSEAGNSIEYSTDGGTTWSSTEPTPSEGSNTVHVREIDSANNPSASTSITYTYDTSAPTVTITTIPLTNDTTPALSGTVDDATATVVVTIGSTDYTAVNNGDGTWTLADNAVAALSDGSTTVSVKATDVAGNTGTSSGTVFVDATAPSAPSVELANDTGTSGTDLITKDGHLTVTPSEAGNSIEYSTDGGTTWSSTEPTPSEGSNTVHVREIDSANNPSASTSITYTYDTSAPTVTITTIPLTNDTTPALSGTVDDATATVVVTIGSTDYTAVNNGDGTWTLADNAVAALSDGSTTVSVKATDVAGNTGTSSGTVFVDATAPSAPSVELANDTGTSGTDLITKDGHLTVTPSEAGNSIEYSTDGGTTWSSTEPTPSEGSNTVHVREIDSANNPSASTSITYTYDTSAPTVTITTIPLTNDTTPALSGTVDDATATVVVTIGSTDYTAVNNGDGTWTLADNAVAALSDGSTTVSVKATDVAGNTGTSSGTVFVDATAPSAPSVELANDTGTSGTDLITKDGHLTVTPSEAGNSIEYSTDGGTTWSSTEPTPSEGSNTVHVREIDSANNPSASTSITYTYDTSAPTVTITTIPLTNDTTPALSGTVDDATATVVVTIGSTDYTAVNNGDGTWTLADNAVAALSDGSTTVSVKATDVAGNTGTSSGTVFVDATAPSAPSVELANDTGTSGTDLITKDGHLTVTPSEAGNSIEYSTDGGTTWSSTEPTPSEGSNTVHVREIDSANNPSASTSITYTYDTSAPTVTITTIPLTNDTTPALSGTVDDATATVVVTIGSTDYTAVNNGDGTWTLADNAVAALSDGSTTVSVKATDVAGNTGTSSGTVFVDATAPSAPSVELANDTGTSGTDLITKDGHLTVTPSEAGNSIEYSTDGGTTWSSTEPTPSEGSNTVHVREIDSANNPSASTSITYTYDTSAPTVTITTIPLTNDTTPALSGTVDDATATVVVTIGSTDYTAVNNGDGTWTLADNAVAALSDGSTTVSVKATDVAGNTGTSSGTVFVDATAPSAPSVELANDTGTSGTDLITKDGHLTVTPSEAGNSIEYSTDGGTTWSSTEPTPSEGSNTVHVREIDSANNPSASTSITYTYDTSAPTVTITTIPLTNDTTPALSGTVDDATATVVVTIGSTDYTAVNNGDGTWTLADNAVAALSDGSTTVSVKATDVAGNTGTSSGTVFVDATAPSAPSVELANDTGTSGTDLITKDGHLTVTPSEAGNSIEYSTDGGTTWSSTEPTPSEGSNTVHVREIDSANNPSASTSITYTYDTSAPTVTITTIPLTNDTTPALSGTVDDATATVVVTIGSTDYTAVNNGDGTWTLADNAVAALSDGSTTVSVKATDVAGNTGTSSGTVFVDATAPSAPSVELANDTGTSGTDLITKDGHLTVTPSEAGNSIEYSTDGGTTWSSTEPTPSEGSNTVHVREIDSANNPSASTSITYTYDTSAPTVTITTIPLTNDTTPTLSGTVDDATATVVVTIGSTDYTAVNNGDGTWTLADNAVAALSDGSTTVSVKATDVAGNTGTSSGTVFVDATAPSAPSVELANDTGTSGTDLITKDGHLTVTPSEAGNSIEYSTDGGTTWSSTEPTPSEGSNTVHVREIDSANNPSASTSITYTYDTSAPTVTITTIPLTNDTTPALSGTVDDATATVVVTIGSTDYTAVNNGDGTWTLADNAVAALSDGSTTVSVKATDVAGNTGTSSGTVFVDATAPSAPSVELANDTGTSGTDLITKDGHLTVTPSEAGNSIEYSTDGGTTWSSTEPTPSEGSNTVHVREIDSANNPSASTSITYTYDTSAPTVTITTIPLTNDTTPALSGTVDDATATVVVTIGSTDYTAVNNGDGTWTLADNAVAALSDGSTTVSVKATDVAGNTGTSSGTVFVDATAPSAPSVELANDTGTSGTDLITKDGHLTVTPSEAGNSIEYSTDGGTTWSSTEPTPSEGSNTVHVREIDSANNPSASTSITYTYDTSAPTVTITTIPLTNDTTPALSGTVDDATATVVVTIGSTDYTAVNNGDGTWTLADNAVAALSDGSTTVSVKATDVAGNTGTSSGTVFVDATAPSAPSVELANDTGTSGTDLITKDGHLTVTPSEAGNSIEYSTDGGTTWSSTEPTPSEGSNTVHVREIDSANNPSASTSITYTYDTSAPTVTITTIPLTNDTTPALSGTVDDATATVVVTIGSTDYTAVNNGDGTWTLADNAVAALSDGSTTVSVKATDVAGNTGTSSGTVFVDATAPSAPSVELANDTGTSGTDLITKDGHLTVTPSEAGNSIEYSTDGGTTWSSTEPTPSEGSNTVHVREIDSANNPSASTSITYTYDTSAPTVTITTIPLTNDTTPALSGTVDDATATVVVTIGSTDYTAVNNGDGTWTLADNAVAALSDGSTTVSVKATDVAGNTGTSSGTVFVDATAPSAPSVELANDTGTSGTDLITKDGHLTVTPSEAGNSIEYSTDGGTTWSSTEPTPSEGSNTVHVREIDSANNPSASTSITYTYDTSAPTVTITTIPLTNDTTPALSGTVDDATATVVVTIGSTDYTAVNNGDGTWTLADNAVAALSDGSTTVSVKATDVAGNTGTSSGTVFVDATAPSAPSAPSSYDDNVGAVQNATSTASTTDDTKPGINVGAGLSDTPTLYVDGVKVAATYDATNGTLTPTTALADGTHAFTYTLTDAAGNESDASGALTIKIDTTAPDASKLAITNIVDQHGDYSSVTMYGTGAEVGNTITLYDEDDAKVATTTVQSNGTWSIDISDLSGTPLGDNEFFKVTETDAAGNSIGQADSTHYWHGDSTSVNTELADDYVFTGDENDTINTDVASVGQENDENDYVVIDGGNGTDTVKFGGNASNYTITTDTNGYTLVTEGTASDSNGDSIGDVTELRYVETIVFADGTYDVATKNFIPQSTNDTISINEDMDNTTGNYILTLNDFGTYSDVDGGIAPSSVRIDALPTNGTLYLDDTAVTLGEVISASDISGGKLTFNPTDNSDADSSFTFSVNDGISWSTTNYTTTIEITAVADAPTLSVNGTQSSAGVDLDDFITIPSSIGLTQKIYNNVSSVVINSANLESTISGRSADSETVVTQPYSTGSTAAEADDIAVGTIEVTSGLIYFEAGTTISFSGYCDDSLQIELGGTVLISTTGDAYGTYDTSTAGTTNIGSTGTVTSTGTYTVSESGYYTLDIYTYNHHGVGELSINVSVNGATAVALNTTNFNLYSNITDIDGQYSSLVSSTNNESGYYPVSLNEGIEGSPIKLTGISAALTDTDDSEVLSITISDIPVGCTISDGTTEHTFTATSTSSSKDVTGWNLDSLTYTAPDVSSSGSINNLIVTATSTEKSNGDTASVSETITVTIHTAPVAVADQAVVGISDTTTAAYYVSNTGVIGTVNLTTGDTTVIGTANTHGTIYDIAETSSGALYAITSSERLYSINTSTGAATSLGTVTGISNGNIYGLTFSSNGTLYAMTSGGYLYSINTTTLAATRVTTYDFGGACDDLVYYNNALYILADNKLLKYDLSTGSVGTIVTGMGGTLYGLALNNDGTIYVIKNDGTAYIVDLASNTYTSASDIDLSGTIYGATSSVMTASTVTVTGDVTPVTTGQDHDADGDTFTVTGITAGSATSATSGVNTTITGTYGTLVMQSDGSYSYTLDESLAATRAVESASKAANATLLYYVDDGGNIGTVDPTTGVKTVLGYSGQAFYDIATTPDGKLYGITGGGYLYSINTSTGAATSITHVNVDEIRGLTSDSSGTLYAETSTGKLYTITTSGVATLVVNFDTALGRDVSTDDILYYDGAIYALTTTGSLLKYDLATHVTTTVAATTSSIADLYGLTVDSDGSIYAFRYDGSIYTVNLTAGTITDTGVDVSGEVIFGATYGYNEQSATTLYGTDTFTYTITDEHGQSSTTTLSINITDPDTTSIIGSVTDTTLTGDSHSNIIISNSSESATLNGGDGSDILIGKDGVSDTLLGGNGNDILYYDAADAKIDGGVGTDYLVLNTGTNIDFSALNTANDPIKNMEVIDLTINGNHSLTNLSLNDVLDMTSSSNHTLTILGDSADKVDFLNNEGWTKASTSVSATVNGTSHTFDVYSNSTDPTVIVRVEQAITDTI